jgi:DUF955
VIYNNKELWESPENKVYNRSGNSEFELQANEFAAAFLMPKELYKRVMDENTVGNTVYIAKVAQYFNVSIDDVLLFFSFDIVNSTLYKTINNYQWVYTIDKILKLVKDKIKAKIPRAEVWRVFGDEIMFSYDS